MQTFTHPRQPSGVMISWLLLAKLLFLNASAYAAAGTWSTTGSMPYDNSCHASALLPNGRVLAAGGEKDNQLPLNTASLYNAITGTWSATSSMSTARYHPSYVLLANGKVLIAGGYMGAWTSVTNTAELYDANTAVFSNTGSMLTARVSNMNILVQLANGKALIAGGSSNATNNPLSSAETYNSATGTWSNTGAMHYPRVEHTVTRLSNGKVLVAGGSTLGMYYAPTTSAELYDPATGTWSNIAPMVSARMGHTATLLSNGKVLVAGGFSNKIWGINLRTAEIYDPITGTWTAVGLMATARGLHSATLLPNGTVLVAGGYSSITSAELYNPSTATWSTTGALGYGTYTHNTTLLNTGKVLLAGGWNGWGYATSRAEVYDPGSFPPAVSTDAPSVVTGTTVKLNGTVNANGAVTTVTFDFGLTTGYGTSIAAVPNTIAATVSAVAVSAAKTGLACNTTYHYRVKAVNSAGITYGSDKSFATSACASADWVVTGVTLTPIQPSAGGTFSAAVTVKNQSAAAGDGKFLDVWTNQATAVTCGAAGNSRQAVGAVAAGAIKTFTFTGLTAGVAGMKTFRAFVDSGCGTVESNEVNNQLTKNYVVSFLAVSMTNLDQFAPQALNVIPGAVVKWTNADTDPHTVTADATNPTAGGPNSSVYFTVS